MAKVMVSMPDELLAEVDAEAERNGSTRSAMLREFTEAAFQRRRTARAEAMRELLRNPGSFGGEVAERIRQGRPKSCHAAA